MNMQWIYKPFGLLTADELYAILRLRNMVFIVEQQCVYLDADNKDQASHHLCGWNNQELIAYARILPPGIAFPEASIGRVLTHLGHRKQGSGKQLMEKAIELCLQLYSTHNIRIGAQLYLAEFYKNLGFIREGDIYLEDGIEHIEMTFTLLNKIIQ